MEKKTLSSVKKNSNRKAIPFKPSKNIQLKKAKMGGSPSKENEMIGDSSILSKSVSNV